ncbi:MAG TPA: urea ABC transporter permease subunit UrtC, partial [Candidatus Methylomirabilis sp.]|nr:urea ABC transporter permease subunit UrtC [Candidatus Methylomirabilis sp.]
MTPSEASLLLLPRKQSRDPQALWAAAFAVVFVVVLPMANVLGILSDYYLNLFGKYLCLAILALGMDLIWGYTGILSLGQAIFFGIGAYSIGMHMLLEVSGKGVYGEPVPDFMIWNQVYQLPLFWKPYTSFLFALGSSVLLPAALATLIGFLTFRRRLRGTYFAILTQAIAFIVWLMLNRNEMKLGGTNGLTDFKALLGFSLNDPRMLRILYVLTALALVACLLLSQWLVRGKTGLIIQAIRDNERRLQFLGYNVASYKVFVFAVSAALAGLAGLLYAPQVGIITPSQVGVLPSLEIVIWVAFGGRGTLWG